MRPIPQTTDLTTTDIYLLNRSTTMHTMLNERLAEARHREACTQARLARYARLVEDERRSGRASRVAQRVSRRLVPILR